MHSTWGAPHQRRCNNQSALCSVSSTSLPARASPLCADSRIRNRPCNYHAEPWSRGCHLAKKKYYHWLFELKKTRRPRYVCPKAKQYVTLSVDELMNSYINTHEVDQGSERATSYPGSFISCPRTKGAGAGRRKSLGTELLWEVSQWVLNLKVYQYDGTSQKKPDQRIATTRTHLFHSWSHYVRGKAAHDLRFFYLRLIKQGLWNTFWTRTCKQS